MTHADFTAGLQALARLQRRDLILAGILGEKDQEGWRRFDRDRPAWFLRAAPEVADALWGLIEKRM